MRNMLLTVAATALGLPTGSEPSRGESTYPWCAQYRGAGARNFGFSTLEQCRATVSGIGGYCEANPMYRPAPNGRDSCDTQAGERDDLE